MKKSVKDILFYSAACALVAVFGILIYSASQKVAFQADASPSAPKPIIIIDVGHGGEDGGAVADDGTLEKDLNLSIATYLYQYFQEWLFFFRSSYGKYLYFFCCHNRMIQYMPT